MNERVPLQTNLLDAGRFAERAEDSFTLPAHWYYEPEIFRLEHEAIFYKTWWYQCHASDIANPGDYYAGAVMDQSIFLVRGDDGEIRAFYNVCSHRAHPLVEGEGNARLIVCPYHQWCYQSDGRFRGARGRDTLKEWIPDNANLKPVRVESYGGFLFVNLDADAAPLAEQAPKLLQDMYDSCPKLDGLRRAERYERTVAANWKTVIDNNHECNHCAVNHKSLLELVDYESKAVWSDDGITFSHAVENKSPTGGAYDVAEDENAQASLFGYIFPCQIPLFFPGSPSCAMFQVIPTGPETTLERWDFYFASDEPSQQERDFIEFIKTVLIPEDVGLCEQVQRGLHSRGYTQGRFVVDRERPEFSEHHVHFFQKMVHDALKGTA
ncbi:MAG: aromatic ring-hydroxylating dioxygenase subunit alpha [Pseudomonadota bacterium]